MHHWPRDCAQAVCTGTGLIIVNAAWCACDGSGLYIKQISFLWFIMAQQQGVASSQWVICRPVFDVGRVVIEVYIWLQDVSRVSLVEVFLAYGCVNTGCL